MQEANSSVKHVIDKFKKKGFNYLSLEELAITQISPNWLQEFASNTGEDWDNYQEKAVERLRRANFNLKWLSRPTSSLFAPLFTAVMRGELRKLEEFITANDLKTCIDAVDENKRSCLHLASREGYAEIVEYLSEQGWAIDARDKLLTTPLHQASNSGHSHVVSFLLIKGADPHAIDISGRTALLYAACSPNSQVVDTLLAHDSALIDDKDFSGRSAIHYAVFNPHSKQVDTMRKLLEFGIPVDVQDSDKRTALHHACEAGKPRAIRLLLKWGASIAVRDLLTNKTPLELSANQNIKQLVLLYSQETKQGDSIRTSKAQKITEDRLPSIKKTPYASSAGDSIQNSMYKEKLLSLLKRIQEAGVNMNQHYIKPQLYSGAWLDKVQSVGNLHKELANLAPSEAVLQVFNVLFPYPKALPMPVSDENDIQAFFGKAELSKKGEDMLLPTDDSRLLKLQQRLQTSDSKNFELQQNVYSLEKKLQEVQFALESKTQEATFSQKVIQELRGKQQEVLNDAVSQEEMIRLKEEKDTANKLVGQLKKMISELQQECLELKAGLEKPNPEQSAEMEQSLEQLRKENRALRFRAGLVLLKGIDNKENVPACDPDVHLQDDEVLLRLESALRDNPPNFKQRLTEADLNKDGKVTKAELTKVLARLVLVPQDIVIILRVSGFRQGTAAVPISDISALLENRQEKRQELESDLFARLAEHFQNSSLSLEQAFQFIDINKDGHVNFQELSEALDVIKLPLNREDRHGLFAVLDSDHNGSISLEEFKVRLENAPVDPDRLNKKKENSFHDKSQGSEDAVVEIRKVPPKIENPRKIQPRESEIGKKISESPIPKPEAINIKPIQAKKPVLIENNVEKKLNPAIQPKAIENLSKSLAQKKLNGSLVIGVVRGKGFSNEEFAAKLSLNGSEKILMTPFMNGPDPDWKYKGRIRLYDTSISQVATEIFVELIGEMGYMASCKIPWAPVLDSPNIWAVKSEYPLIDAYNKKYGSMFVHLMWMPKDVLRIEGEGSLSIQILSCKGFPKSLIQLSMASCNTIGALQQNQTIIMKDIKLKGDEPIPSLKCSILAADTRQVIIWRNLSVESAVTTSDWTAPLKVPLEDNREITLKMKWELADQHEIDEENAAVKIQAAFRGRKAREEMNSMHKPVRKMVARRVVKENKRYYMVSVYDEESNYQLELNPADDPKVPMFMGLDSAKVPKQPIEDLLSTIKILPSHRFSIPKGSSLEENFEVIKKKAQLPSQNLRGQLVIDICKSANIGSSYCRFEYGERFALSAAGPPWENKVVLSNIVLSGPPDLLIVKLYSLDTRKELGSDAVAWAGALSQPDKWTQVTKANIERKVLELKFLWSENALKPEEEIKETSFAPIEENLIKKNERKAISRRGIKQNGRYYFVCAYEGRSGIEIELHLADQPNSPLYTVLDSALLEKSVNIEEILSNLKIMPNHKMTFKS